MTLLKFKWLKLKISCLQINFVISVLIACYFTVIYWPSISLDAAGWNLIVFDNLKNSVHPWSCNNNCRVENSYSKRSSSDSQKVDGKILVQCHHLISGVFIYHLTNVNLRIYDFQYDNILALHVIKYGYCFKKKYFHLFSSYFIPSFTALQEHPVYKLKTGRIVMYFLII